MYGHDTMDGSRSLRELLNVSLSAHTCGVEDLLAVGADPDRIALMERKYTSLQPVPPYSMAYGTLFRRHQGIDQISTVIDRLRRKPETKQATIGFHVPGEENLSCVSLLDFKIRHGLLHTNAVYRSQNIFASQPGNAVALRHIQEEVAAALAVDPGPLTLHVLSAHVYEHDQAVAAELVGLDRFPIPRGEAE